MFFDDFWQRYVGCWLNSAGKNMAKIVAIFFLIVALATFITTIIFFGKLIVTRTLFAAIILISGLTAGFFFLLVALGAGDVYDKRREEKTGKK